MKLEIPLGTATGRAPRRSVMIRQVAMLLAAALVSTFAGYTVYTVYQRFGPTSQAVAPPQTVQARLGSLVSTVTSTGSVVATHLAKLSFSADGKLVELNVAVGANVKEGQLLARQDTAPLQATLVSAESALKVAQINLEQLKAGATPDELEAAKLAYDLAVVKYQQTVAGATAVDRQAAQSAVDQATSNLASAQVKLNDLKADPTQVDLIAAEGAIAQAKTSLALALAKLEEQKAGPTQAEWISAQGAVDTARSSVKTAQSKLDLLKAGPTQADLSAATAQVNQAKASLISAEDKYQQAQNGDLGSASSNSAVQQSYEAAKANYDSALKKLQQLLEGPTAADLETSQSSVDSAQVTLNAATAKLEQMKRGPLASELISSQGSVDSARNSLASAQAKLDQLNAGPTETELNSAQGAVDSANASLATAQAKLDDLLAGPKEADLLSAKGVLVGANVQLASKTTVKESDIILQEEKVRQAQAALDQAKLDLDSATITAPFDGIVSSASANAGERVASNATVITLVDPTAFRIDVVVDETDVVKLAVGQTAAIGFDALPDQRLQARVISVAPSGVTTQGVVSYPVSLGVENPGRTFPAGMSATASIVTEQKDNVLLVPNRAVRTSGRNRLVDVMVGDKTETRTVQVGSSDDQYTQIVSGVQQGETVIIPVTTVSPQRGGISGPGIPAVKAPGR